MTNEVILKGIILSLAPQGEYGRRLRLLTDSLGKITAFASGAAKPGSRIIGSTRPFTFGEFTLHRGKTAWNLHEIKVMDAFDELNQDPDVSFCAFYVLEVAEYFSAEGMDKEDAKSLLNLMYVTFCALRNFFPTISLSAFSASSKASSFMHFFISSSPPPKLSVTPTPSTLSSPSPTLSFIRRIFELRLLKLQGEYTLEPDAEENNFVKNLWEYILQAPLSTLYNPEKLMMFNDSARDLFCEDVKKLFKKQVPKTFNSEKLMLK